MTPPEPITEVVPVGPQYAVPGTFASGYPYNYPYIRNRPYEAPVGWVYTNETEAQRYRREKPAGYMLLPYPTDKEPPKNSPTPQTNGHWITINPGWGNPPVYGFLARETGLESEDTGSSSSAKGHYVYVSGDAWVWVPEVDVDFGTK